MSLHLSGGRPPLPAGPIGARRVSGTRRVQPRKPARVSGQGTNTLRLSAEGTRGNLRDLHLKARTRSGRGGLIRADFLLCAMASKARQV